jgi:large subunit ribosomal protein L4e
MRPTVTVQKEKGKVVTLPGVFLNPIRYDIVRFVHSAMNLNGRQPYAVSRRAGHQNSAESWGTGRAVARIPRCSGGGTQRSGQGAFGNMCRGGRMFAPTKVFRKWTRKVNSKIRKVAVRAALAASGIPALVMARGHNIENVPEVPLVVPNAMEGLEKTKDAVKLLRDVGLRADLEKVIHTHGVRAGKGKRRNRRYRTRKGPLIVVSKPCKAFLAFRNLLGVDVQHVRHLNLLKLTPGGHVGRMIVWSEDAFNQLDKIFGGRVPHVPDSKRVINSEEVQGVLRKKRPSQSKNRKNLPRPKLNPAAKMVKKFNKHQEKLKALTKKSKKAAVEPKKGKEAAKKDVKAEKPKEAKKEQKEEKVVKKK